MGYSPWGRKELDMPEHTHVHTLNISVFSANSLGGKYQYVLWISHCV